MHTGDVKAVPPVAATSRAEGAAVLLPRIVDRVVLAGHGEHLRCLEALHHLLGLVELVGAGQVRDVAGVNDEIRCVAEVVDAIDRLAECVGDVGVGRSGEAEVTVADLGEPQGRPGLGLRARSTPTDHLTAHHGETDRRAKPCRVPEELAATHAIGIAGHEVTTTVPRIMG